MGIGKHRSQYNFSGCDPRAFRHFEVNNILDAARCWMQKKIYLACKS
jgi:hypothetical protein